MRVYAASSPATRRTLALLAELRYPWVLPAFKSTIDPLTFPYRPGLILDSGAFSVWSIGKTIDLGQYVAWATALRESYGGEVMAINLDVIPGEPGRSPTPKERERAITESAENAEAIRATGLPVVEVYHRFEPLTVLEAILARRRPGEIVAFGGLVGKLGGLRGKVEFCDAAFSYLRDASGGWGSLIPVHGLGLSGDSPVARRYPWFSVDSTAWATQRNFNLHVTRDGSFVGRNRETAPRTTKDMVLIFSRRRLERWMRYERALTAEWARRGVRFAGQDAP